MMPEIERYVATDGAVLERRVFKGSPCPDAPHNCRDLGCGRVEVWPIGQGDHAE